MNFSSKESRLGRDGHETVGWHQNYGDAAAVARRRRDMGTKLDRLGLCMTAPVAVLDVCCGHGETLDCLYSLGFRDLHGVDLTVPRSLANDGRFDVRQASATKLPYDSGSFDWVLCIHSLHHLGSAAEVEYFLYEVSRVLKPGGRLGIVDFPASLQIRLAFWLFRHGFLNFTPYLKWFTRVIREEWWFLREYLPQWTIVRRHLMEGPFAVEVYRDGFFYFHLTLRKAS